MTTLMNGYPGTGGAYEAGLVPRFQRAAGAVLHFFTDQMTSPRPEEAMQGQSVHRNEGVVDLRAPNFAPKWVEAGRVGRDAA